jgi:hypothetical protein
MVKPSELIEKLQLHISRYGDDKDIEIRFAHYNSLYDTLTCATDTVGKLYGVNGVFTITTNYYETDAEPLMGDFEE